MPPTTLLVHEDDEVAAAKAALRRHIRAARRQQRTQGGEEARQLDGEEIKTEGMQWLAQHALDHRPVRCVTAYESMANEPPMAQFVEALRVEGVRVIVPITLLHGELRWRDADPSVSSQPMGAAPDETTGATWGEEILREVDVAFIPALAIRHDGARLGQGGGYYDRAIPALRGTTPGSVPRAAHPKAPVIAVVYASEIRADLPTHAHDIRVDAVLTPGGMRPITPPGPAPT